MPLTVVLPDELVSRLGTLAKPFVELTPVDVIFRLAGNPESVAHHDSTTRSERVFVDRFPRQRGIRTRVGGELIVAHAVKDLYDQTLHALSRSGKLEELVEILPVRTSSRRYLAATEPIHPNGNPFFVPVRHASVFMETHKSYQTAVSHLAAMLTRIGVSFEVLD
jgi:hypothetical protein